MNMQEEQNHGEKAPAEKNTEQTDTDQNITVSVKEEERSIKSDKEINLSDEDHALDSGI